MQGEEAKLDIPDLHPLHQLTTEVQPRGRSHYGSLILREDILVAFQVLRFRRSLQILGDGRLTHLEQLLFKLLVRPVIQKPQGAAPRGGVIDHLGHQLLVFTEVKLVPNSDLPGWVHQHIPQVLIGIQFPQQEDFNFRSRFLLIPEQAGRKHHGIVEDKKILRVKIVQYVLENTVFNLVGMLVYNH